MFVEQDPNETPIPHEGSAAPSAPVDALTVLIVEDDEDQFYVMKVLFERAGWNVCGFQDGTEAIQSSCATPVDAAVVDMMLPGSSGFQVVQAIRAKHGPYVPVIMVSGQWQTAHRDYADILGINMFLPKPFDASELLQHMQALCVPPKTMTV
jgi:two-component system, OmpR family, response regulator